MRPDEVAQMYALGFHYDDAKGSFYHPETKTTFRDGTNRTLPIYDELRKSGLPVDKMLRINKINKLLA